MRAFLLLVLLALQTRAFGSQVHPISLVFAPAPSPDGSTFAFEWDDDIWLASTDSGEARRIISAPGRDMFPQFSPDGSRIFFSSERSGSIQLYSATTDGKEITPHTLHTEGNFLECLSPDGSRALVRGLRDRSGYRPWRLLEVPLSGPPRETMLFDASAHSAAWSPDGRRILFCRGGELPYRRGFRGSRAARIWSYEIASRSFHCEIPGDFEARTPIWMPDGSGFYFVSNESGTANLWEKRVSQPPRQLTFHKDEDILTPGLSRDGSTLLYRHGFDLRHIHPQRPDQPRRLRVFTRESFAARDRQSLTIQGCHQADILPSSRTIVFSEQGELWLVSRPGAKTIRLTESACAEESPRFSPDGSRLYFLSDDGLRTEIHRARLDGQRLVEVSTLYSTAASIRSLSPSPDGSRIAWIEARGDIRVCAADGSGLQTLFPCWDSPTFDWSPDGRWLAIAAEDANANRDVYLVAADSATPPVNLTRHPAFDGSPRWSPDGTRLVFTSKRGPAGTAALWCIDFGKSGLSKDSSPATLQAKADKAKPLPTRDIEPRRVIWSHEPDRLYFQNRKTSDHRLYQLDLTSGGITTAFDSSGIPLRVMPDGTLLWRVKRVPHLLHQGTDTPVPIHATFERSHSGFLRLGFRRIWRTLGERFHDESMKGRDWPAMRDKYEDRAAAAVCSFEFDHVVGRLMGELNSSHLVFQHKPWDQETKPSPPGTQTLHPGLRFAPPDQSPGLLITEIIPGSPASRIRPALVRGETITHIAGHPVGKDSPLLPLFTGPTGMELAISIRDPQGGERTAALLCITYAQARELDAKARSTRARNVLAAHPHIAYLHLPDMSRDSLHTMEIFLHRASTDQKRALILDLRDNGGGREANRMLAMLQQTIPFTTRPRGGPDGYPMDRLPAVPWPHPVAVLCNQNTYSNSEIFCHAYLASGRGPLIGTATAGGVISAVMTDILGLGKLQIPFRTWQKPGTTTSLDLSGARPTLPVDLTPHDEHHQLDPQLAAAIQALARP